MWMSAFINQNANEDVQNGQKEERLTVQLK